MTSDLAGTLGQLVSMFAASSVWRSELKHRKNPSNNETVNRQSVQKPTHQPQCVLRVQRSFAFEESRQRGLAASNLLREILLSHFLGRQQNTDGERYSRLTIDPSYQHGFHNSPHIFDRYLNPRHVVYCESDHPNGEPPPHQIRQ